VTAGALAVVLALAPLSLSQSDGERVRARGDASLDSPRGVVEEDVTAPPRLAATGPSPPSEVLTADAGAAPLSPRAENVEEGASTSSARTESGESVQPERSRGPLLHQPRAPGEGERGRVVLTITGDGEGQPALAASTRELLSRLGLAVEDSDDPAALAKVSMELGSGECTLSVTDASGRLAFFRRLARGGSTSLLVESAAHVVQSAVEELVLASERPPPRTELPPPSPPPPPPTIEVPARVPPPPPPERVGIDLSAFLGARLFGGASVSFSGGLSVALAARLGSFRPSVALSAAWQPLGPISTEVQPEGQTQSVQLDGQVVSARLVPSLDLFRGRTWSLELGVGGGADIFVVSARLVGLPLRGEPPRAHVGVAPVATVQLTARFAVARSADLFVRLGLDADPAPLRFVADFGPDREPVYQPMLLRPTLVFGFSLSPIGTPYPGAP